MKKKLVFKIILNLSLFFCFIYFLYDFIYYLRWFIETDRISKLLEFPTIFSHFKYETVHLVISLISIILLLTSIIMINFKGTQWLCGSIGKEMKDRKEATAEERKQKKIEELEKQLDELKKE